jgi:hypothetical protein
MTPGRALKGMRFISTAAVMAAMVTRDSQVGRNPTLSTQAGRGFNVLPAKAIVTGGWVCPLLA